MQPHPSLFHRILVWITCFAIIGFDLPPQSLIGQSDDPRSDKSSQIYLPLVTGDDTPENVEVSASQRSIYLPVVAKGNSNQPSPTPTSTPVTTPSPTDGTGWVSGVVYDSVTCDQYLTTCKPVVGAHVTLATVDTVKLAQVRASRKALLVASGYAQPLAPSKDLSVTSPVPGEAVTDAQGAFHFPVDTSGTYWLRVEKSGYTYGQRQVEIVKKHSTATDAIYLTPLDDKVTSCTTSGCTHANSDNSIQLVIPAGAIPAGQTVDVTATNYKQFEFLPSGDLPEGTWETYAFNLGGDSEYAFQPGTKATVRLKNDKGFLPGTKVPLGYWNQATQAWEHAGTGIVDSTGQWVSMEVVHFSNYDCNDPISPPSLTSSTSSSGGNSPSTCNGEQKCFIDYKSGTLQEWVNLPSVQVLGKETAPQLRYSSDRAHPSAVIDVELKLDASNSTEIGKYIGWELYIEGEKTKSFTFDANLQSGGYEGRYRYLWDGQNAQGEQLLPGIYDYKVKLSVPYKGQYCYTLGGIFGNPPDCVNGATGQFVDAVKEFWVRGTVTLDDQSRNPFGSGWTLDEWQHLHTSENNRLLITDGRHSDEFLFPGQTVTPIRRGNISESVLAWVNVAGNSMQSLPERLAREWNNDTPHDTIIRYTFTSSDGAPSDIALSPDGLYSYVIDRYSSFLSVINLETKQLSNTIPIGNSPLDIALTANGTTAYVVNSVSNTISVVDLIAQTELATIATSQAPVGIALSPDESFAYVIHSCCSIITVIDLISRQEVDTINLENNAKAIVVSPDGAFAYAIDSLNYVSVIDLSTRKEITKFGGTSGLYDLVLSPDGRYAYFTDIHKYVSVVDLTNRQEITRINLESIPERIALSSDGTIAYVTHFFNQSSISVVDLVSRQVVTTIPTDKWPTSITVSKPTSGTGIYSRTATDHSVLTYNRANATYTRIYPDGKQVHFNTNGTHDYTLKPDGLKTAYTYNIDGTLATLAITPPGSSSPRWTWRFSYANGKLTGVSDPAGRVTTFVIDGEGHLTSAQTPDTATLHFGYDNRHLLTQYTDPKGAITDYTYDKYGRVSVITSPSRPIYNPATGFTESKREVRRLTPSDTGYTLINDSTVGNPANPAPRVPTSLELVDRVIYGRGQRIGHTNRWGSWLDVTDGISRTTVYERDTADNVLRQTYPNGECVTYTYNANGNPLTEDHFAASACAAKATVIAGAEPVQSWNYTYEPRFNHLKTEIDPLGQTTTYVYEYEENKGNAGHLIRIEYPQVKNEKGSLVTPKLTYSYDALGLLETETNLQGIITRYLYTQGSADEASGGANARFAQGVSPVPGLLTKMIEDSGDTSHLNLTTTYKDFDAQGNAQTEVDPRGNVTRYSYDALGRLLTKTDPLGEVTKYEYDGRGNMVRLIAGYTADSTSGRNQITTFTYDGENRLLSTRTETDGQVRSATLAYDINGELATYKGSEGQVVTYGYDAADQLSRITNPLGQVTQFTYTDRRQLTTAILANNTTISFTYDAFGNLSSLTPPGRAPHLFNYTLRNESAGYRPPSLTTGATDTTFTYDAMARLLQSKQPDGKSITYSYDSLQRLYGISFSRGLITYGYHPANSQLTGIYAPGGISLTLNYDKERLITSNWTGLVNGSVSFTYDSNGRRTGIGVNNAAQVSFQYDSTNRLIQAGDLTIQRLRQSREIQATTLAQVIDARTYDAFSKLTRYQAKSGATTLYQVDYTYDKLNRIATKTETIGGTTTTYTYGYDGVGRLIEVKQNGITLESYSYDPNGNRSTGPGSATGTYDAQDRLLTYGGVSFTYTANGELNSKTVGTQRTTYLYDELGNLTSVTLPDSTKLDYVIDGQNRRIGKKANGVLVQGWLYESQLRPIAELDGNGNVVSRYVYGDRINVPEYLIKGSATYRLILDHLGSVRLVVNAQTGAVAQRIDYDAFGKVLQDTSPGFQPFGFAGGFYDSQTGLVRFGARDYDSGVGRWTAKDSIGFGGGDANLYGYVSNKPVNFIDTQGVIQECPSSPPNNKPNWIPYNGYPWWFHCGYDSFLENRNPDPNDPVQECVYDENNNLVGDKHPYSGCKGTPDQYSANDWRHICRDKGGICAHGWDAFLDSRKHDLDQIWQACSRMWDDIWSQYLNVEN